MLPHRTFQTYPVSFGESVRADAQGAAPCAVCSFLLNVSFLLMKDMNAVSPPVAGVHWHGVKHTWHAISKPLVLILELSK